MNGILFVYRFFSQHMNEMHLKLEKVMTLWSLLLRVSTVCLDVNQGDKNTVLPQWKSGRSQQCLPTMSRASNTLTV